MNKMVAISQTTFRCIFVKDNFCILIKISLKFVPKGSIDPALVWIMDWRRIGVKPLSEPMLTQLTDAYIWHQGEMSSCAGAWRYVYTLVNWVIIGSGNGLSLVWLPNKGQAIT